jgi:tRNA threonylcarbamoyladenosine biosynthesis protein TsaE
MTDMANQDIRMEPAYGDTRGYGPEGLLVRSVTIATGQAMRDFGSLIAGLVHGGDILLLSGPLGAGKTTFAQGFGAGLGIQGSIVSPTFTLARELNGHFSDGTAAHLVHVDAYRLGGDGYAPGQDRTDRLLDELEAIGLDEELEAPGERTVILMEWGEQMVSALAPERLELHIDRPMPVGKLSATQRLSADGPRVVSLVPVGKRWQGMPEELEQEICQRVPSASR